MAYVESLRGSRLYWIILLIRENLRTYRGTICSSEQKRIPFMLREENGIPLCMQILHDLIFTVHLSSLILCQFDIAQFHRHPMVCVAFIPSCSSHRYFTRKKRGRTSGAIVAPSSNTDLPSILHCYIEMWHH